MSDASRVPRPPRESPAPQIPAEDRARLLGRASDDPVESWKAAVRARVVDENHTDAPALHFQVSLGFFVLACLLGASHGVLGSIRSVALLGSALFTQELTRALYARTLGRSARVFIAANGGETELSGPPLRGVSAAVFVTVGSIVNVLVGLGALAISRRTDGQTAQVFRVLGSTQLAWGSLQLLPLIPFRLGGLVAARLSPSLRFAHAGASVVLISTLCVGVLTQGRAPIFAALLGIASLAMLEQVGEAYRERRDARHGLDVINDRAKAAIAAGRSLEARQLTENALASALSKLHRERLGLSLAWAGIGQSDPFVAHGALLCLPARAIDVHLLAAYLNACNRTDEAIELLQYARGLGHRSSETTKLLADLLFRRGDHAAIRNLATTDTALLSARDKAAIDAALVQVERAPACSEDQVV